MNTAEVQMRIGSRRVRGAIGKAATCAALAMLCGDSALAQEITIGKIERFTDNRGWNEAGIGPTYQFVLTAVVAPSGLPTLVFAEQGSVKHALVHFPTPGASDLYVYWRHVDPTLTGSWSITAEREGAKTAPHQVRAMVHPRQIPLAIDVRVEGAGLEPRVTWSLPDLSGFSIDRIRVVVRGGQRLHQRFLAAIYVSEDLAPTATSFRIPSGVLKAHENYVFQVSIEDLEAGELENRSLTFSQPYSARP